MPLASASTSAAAFVGCLSHFFRSRRHRRGNGGLDSDDAGEGGRAMARVQQKEREREMEAGGGGVDGPAVAAHRFGLQKTSSSLSRRRGVRWPRRHEGWMPFRLSHPTSLLNRRAREGSTAAHLSLNRRRRKKKEVFFFRVLRMKKAREKREQSFIF